jgi:eukaryotic-like serine/threonine-protein kinase
VIDDVLFLPSQLPHVEALRRPLEFTLYAPVSVSETGVLVYRTGGVQSRMSQVVWIDRAGNLVASVGPPGQVAEPSSSPDEKLVAFSRTGRPGGADIWLWDQARRADTRFTFDDSAQQHESAWSPKGDRIVFNSNRLGHFDLYQRAANGSGKDELLLSTPNDKTADQWSKDGRFVIYSEVDPKSKRDLWVLPVGPDAPADRKPVPFLTTEFNEIQGQLSPDSRWMAYVSDESGQSEVYVRPFPAADGKWRISTAGGEQPRWRGDGKELFFVAADGTMTAVAVGTSGESTHTLEAATQVPLFDAHLVPAGGGLTFQYDVSADGQRFLINKAGEAAQTLLNVIVNWTEELKARAPTR